MKPEYYNYPAVFSPDGGMWTVTFPDIENAFTSAETIEEAIVEAQAVLEDCMYFREAQGDVIPSPTPLENIARPSGGLVQMVVAVMPPVRRSWSRRIVKKTLAIPAWLDDKLRGYNSLDVSMIFQEAVKEKLHIQEPVLA